MSSQRKKRTGACLNTFCSVLPTHSAVLSEDVFGVTDETVTFPDSKLENTSTYKFNHVFNGFRDLQNAFEKAYAPMIRTVNVGENVMLVFGGLPIAESMDYFTSMNGRVGIINQAAQVLLRTNTISSSNSNTTITLSWFKIDNSESENISDLLRQSSSLHAGDKSNDVKDSNLVLRELGKGRGMIVPGLWEVEITKPQDVDAVIAHVQRMLPFAKHDGRSHSIIQLAVTPNNCYDDDNNKSKLKEDSPEIGRLTFVLLSNVASPPSSELSSQHMELYSWVSLLEEILGWIDNKRPSPPFHRSRILLLLRDALCTRMTSGISLFIQPTIDGLGENTIWLQLLSHISSTVAERSTAINTLPIHSSVSVAPMLAASGQNSMMTKEQALLRNATSVKQNSSTMIASASPASGVKGKPRFNSSTNPNSINKSGKKGILKNNNVKSSPHHSKQNPSSSHGSPYHGRLHYDKNSSQLTPSADRFSHHLPHGDDMAAPFEDGYGDPHARDFDRHAQYDGYRDGNRNSPPPAPSEEEVRQQRLYQHQLQYQRDFYEKQMHASASGSLSSNIPPPNQQRKQDGNVRSNHPELLSPPPPPPHVSGAPSQGNYQQSRNGELKYPQSQSNESNQISHQHQMGQESMYRSSQHQQDSFYDNSLLPPQIQQGQGDENIPPRENEKSKEVENREMCDMKDAETVKALLISLQSSRDEVESLKKSLILCQKSLEFHKSEHESLKAAKESMGSTLKAKDREKLKKALQELKDYEVYREVMEAAMSRMQNEIDKLESDNVNHKQMTGHLEKELRKSKNITNKITRETSDFEKSKAALHERVSAAEKEARKMSRERDAAVLALSQFKAEKARDEEDLKSSRRVKHKEVLELKKKLADVNMQLKLQIEEGESAALLHTQDLKKLQTAHKKSLEMLMTCQEENDLLRSTLADMEEKTNAVERTATRTPASHKNIQEKRNVSAPSPLSHVFQGEDELVESSSDDKKKHSEKSDDVNKRRKTIVFVDDYENGDVYIEGDESSVLTGDTENSSIEISQRLIQGSNNGGDKQKQRLKSISDQVAE